LGLARQGYISNIEMGHRDPSLEMVIRVADYFNVPVDYLLRDTIPIDPDDPVQRDAS
jgi:transcriptional regulator with XRE-family HTH domain